MDRLATVLPARGVIATSEAAGAAQDRLRPARHRRVVHPGIDLGRFDPGQLPPREVVREELGLPAGAPLVGFFGRLQRWKGVGVLVEAMPRVLQTIPDARCVIVGGRHDLEAGYPEHLQDRIAVLGLERHVTMAGFQTDVARWMHAMDVIALPSDNEPFGITVVEAMAMGKPVIAGDSGGPKEIITTGVNGVLVAHDDEQALAARDSRIPAATGLLRAPGCCCTGTGRAVLRPPLRTRAHTRRSRAGRCSARWARRAWMTAHDMSANAPSGGAPSRDLTRCAAS